MTQKQAVKKVCDQIIAMLYNDISEGYGVESFEGWCENGEVFRLDGECDDPEHCWELAQKVANSVDKLTYELEQMMEP